MFLRLKKIVALSAAIILVAAWFVSGALQNQYVGYPRSPNPDDGRVVPLAVKGIVVYITERQQDTLSWLQRIEIGSGLIVVVVILMHGGDPFRSRKKN